MLNAVRIAWLYFRVGAMNELQYRVNFLLTLVQSLINLGTGLIALWLVFSHTGSLHGWHKYELLAVMGVYTVMNGFITAGIQPNMQRLMEDIQQGTLDYALTKPEDAQLLVSVREIKIWQGVDVITGAVVLGVALAHLKDRLGPGEALAFAYLLLVGAVLIYCFWLILTTMAFWLIRMDQIIELFQGVYASGRYPVDIYPVWLRLGLTFLVPVAFAVTVPVEALTGRLNTPTLLGATGLAILLLVGGRLFWRVGLRNYSGASA